MAEVRIVEELVVKAPTRVGLLAEIADALGAAGVDIRAIGAYDKGDMGEFMLLTGDNTTAEKTLMDMGATVDRNEVVVVSLEQRAGKLQDMSRALAKAEINVEWIYATTGDGEHTNVVIRTAEPARAQQVLSG